MQRAIDNNIKFIQGDEAVNVFKSWYKKYENIEVYYQNMKVVIHASEVQGLENYVIHPRYQASVVYRILIRHKYNDQQIILFVDNLSVHKTKESQKAYEELNITHVYNVPYSSQFNGIQFYFSQIKTHQKKLLLNHLMHDLPIDTVDLIQSSCKRVSVDKITICEREGRMNVNKQVLDINE